MGYFYAGGKTNQQIHARGKIGESNQKYLSSRVGKIRNDEGNFVVFEYLEIPNSTKAITRSIEGDVRLMLERAGYKNIQNDHFVWETTKERKMEDYHNFAHLAIQFAMAYCDFRGIPYIHHVVANGSVRKNVKRRK